MNTGILLAGIAAALVVGSTRKSSTWKGVPYSANTPDRGPFTGGEGTGTPEWAQQPPAPVYVPTVYVPPATTPAPLAPMEVVTLAQVVGRVIAAASTGNPSAMRAEAAMLRSQGWPQHASDLEELATRTEGLRAQPVAPVKPPVAAPPVYVPPAPPVVVVPPAPVKPPVPTPAPLPLPPSSPPVVAPAPVSMLGLKQGVPPGAAVTAWQTVLRADGHGNLPVASNTFGPDTHAATVALQQDRGLPATGIVDASTLNCAALPAIIGGRYLKLDSRGGAVKSWQRVLISSGQTQVVEDGHFGSETVNATKFWQQQRKIEADGEVGPKTVAAMGIVVQAAALLPITTAAVTAAVANIFSTTFNPATWRYLKLTSPTMKGKDVEEWQTILARDGFSEIKPDGDFGPKTMQTTKLWQASRKLAIVDGEVGPATRAAIVLNPIGPPPARVSGFELPEAKPWRDFVPTAPLPGMPHQVPTELVAPERALASKLALHLCFAKPGAEDRALVQLFQVTNGLNATGAYGPGTAEVLMGYGIIPPKPRAWPSKGSMHARAKYRAALKAQARRDPQRALEWNAAARAVDQ